MDVAGTVKSQGDLVVNGAYRGNIGSKGGAPFPRPAFDTGWINISHGQELSVVHNLGGDVDNYFIDLQFKDPNGIEINNKGIGGYEKENNKQGAWYYNLNNYSLKIYKQTEANWVDFFRIRIWVVK